MPIAMARPMDAALSDIMMVGVPSAPSGATDVSLLVFGFL